MLIQFPIEEKRLEKFSEKTLSVIFELAVFIMRQLLILTFSFLALTGFSQLKSLVDTSKYKLTKTIFQNGSKFNFWKGCAAETVYNVVMERRFNGKRKLFEMQPAMNGQYSLKDKNGDGFSDFVTNYHGYDIIYLFHPINNQFEVNPIHIPEVTELIDKKQKIYWSYCESQYSDRKSFSLLYQFSGSKLREQYKIVYVTKEDFSEHIIRLDLYQLAGKSELFLKTIKEKNPLAFKCGIYWKRNYLQLLGYHQ